MSLIFIALVTPIDSLSNEALFSAHMVQHILLMLLASACALRHVTPEHPAANLPDRSGDIAIGIPFNLAAYSLLTMILAQEADLAPGLFSHTIVDAHIYVNHVEGLKEQLTRTPRPLPQITIARKPLDELRFEDFTLTGYDPYPAIKFEVAV